MCFPLCLCLILWSRSVPARPLSRPKLFWHFVKWNRSFVPYFCLKRNLNHPHLFQLIYGMSPSLFILVSWKQAVCFRGHLSMFASQQQWCSYGTISTQWAERALELLTASSGIVVLFSYSAHLKEKDVNEEVDWKRCLHSPICSMVHCPILLLKLAQVLFPYAPTIETWKMNMSFIDILRLKTY